MPDMSDYLEPLPTELEQIYDECRADAGLPPACRSAGQGVADMRARIEYHTDLIAKLAAQPETPAILAALADCRSQLAYARACLPDYERLQRSGN